MSAPELDRATLDANYNLRAAVPEHPVYFARYEAASEAFRQRAGGRLDLAYGDGPRQAIDLFLPRTASAPKTPSRRARRRCWSSSTAATGSGSTARTSRSSPSSWSRPAPPSR